MHVHIFYYFSIYWSDTSLRTVDLSQGPLKQSPDKCSKNKNNVNNIPKTDHSVLQLIPVTKSDSNIDNDSDIPDSAKCCLCYKYEHEKQSRCVQLFTTKWIRCGKTIRIRCTQLI